MLWLQIRTLHFVAHWGRTPASVLSPRCRDTPGRGPAEDKTRGRHREPRDSDQPNWFPTLKEIAALLLIGKYHGRQLSSREIDSSSQSRFRYTCVVLHHDAEYRRPRRLGCKHSHPRARAERYHEAPSRPTCPPTYPGTNLKLHISRTRFSTVYPAIPRRCSTPRRKRG